MNWKTLFLSVFSNTTRTAAKSIATGTLPKIGNLYSLHGLGKRRVTRNILRGKW